MRIEQILLTNQVTKNHVVYSESCLKSLVGKNLGLPVTLNFDSDKIVGVLAETRYEDGKLIGKLEINQSRLREFGVDLGHAVFRPAGLTPHHIIKDSENNRVIDRLRIVTIGMISHSLDVFGSMELRPKGTLSIWNRLKMFFNRFSRLRRKR